MELKKIASFQVDHTKLDIGMYLSRMDGDIMTYDVRLVKPNGGTYLSSASMHTIEHLFATYVRNSSLAEHVVYFGPMGCRTGHYLLLAGDYSSRDVLQLVKAMFEFIRDYEGDIPGAAAHDCGNYLDMNLPMARYLAQEFLDRCLNQIEDKNLYYPEN